MAQSQIPPEESSRSSGESARTVEATQEMSDSRRMLLRIMDLPWWDIYRLSPDGTTYQSPTILCGVPTQRIDEQSPYWEKSWDSLDDFLAKQADNSVMKAKLYAQLQLDPKNAVLIKKHKECSDDSSKYIKIREIFGPETRYHPNQLVAKKHLPHNGLCQKDRLYNLALRISDINCLKDRGHLHQSMDSYEFVRWRVAKLAIKRLPQIGGSARSFIAGLVDNLGNPITGPTDKLRRDAMMREAAIMAADYQNRGASFGPKRNRNKNSTTTAKASTPYRRPAAASQRSSQADAEELAAARSRKQAERRARFQQQAPGYTGVNSFRAKQNASTADSSRHLEPN